MSHRERQHDDVLFTGIYGGMSTFHLSNLYTSPVIGLGVVSEARCRYSRVGTNRLLKSCCLCISYPTQLFVISCFLQLDSLVYTYAPIYSVVRSLFEVFFCIECRMCFLLLLLCFGAVVVSPMHIKHPAICYN